MFVELINVLQLADKIRMINTSVAFQLRCLIRSFKDFSTFIKWNINNLI